MSERSRFNFELDQIRKMWGLRKGVTLVYNEGELRPVGYMISHRKPFNDNEAKP